MSRTPAPLLHGVKIVSDGHSGAFAQYNQVRATKDGGAVSHDHNKLDGNMRVQFGDNPPFSVSRKAAAANSFLLELMSKAWPDLTHQQLVERFYTAVARDQINELKADILNRGVSLPKGHTVEKVSVNNSMTNFDAPSQPSRSTAKPPKRITLHLPGGVSFSVACSDVIAGRKCLVLVQDYDNPQAPRFTLPKVDETGRAAFSITLEEEQTTYHVVHAGLQFFAGLLEHTVLLVSGVDAVFKNGPEDEHGKTSDNS